MGPACHAPTGESHDRTARIRAAPRPRAVYRLHRRRVRLPLFGGYNYLVFDPRPPYPRRDLRPFSRTHSSQRHFTAPSPPARESFDFPHTINNGRWYSMYPPGWPLLLALGVLVQAPWLINPILGGLTILLLFSWARIHGRRTGILAAILGSVSIWLLLMWRP